MTEDPDAVRIHLAAHDPTFPARRDAAYDAVAHTIDAVLAPKAYLRRGQGWSITGPGGRAVVHLGRDRFGWQAVVTLRFCATGAEEDEEQPLADLTDPAFRLVYADVGDVLLDRLARLLDGPGCAWIDGRIAG